MPSLEYDKDGDHNVKRYSQIIVGKHLSTSS